MKNLTPLIFFFTLCIIFKMDLSKDILIWVFPFLADF